MWGWLRRLFHRREAAAVRSEPFLPAETRPAVRGDLVAKPGEAQERPSAPAAEEAATSPSTHPPEQEPIPRQEAPPVPAGPPPEWLVELPPKILFVDVETTGLHSSDRVVSIGAILLETAGLERRQLAIRFTHLVFDPGRKSHPQAERVHGYDDWMLRHQQQFADNADSICDLLDEAGLVVAHNADFDMRFINAELANCGRKEIVQPIFCTMRACRASGQFARSSLSSVARALGLERQGDSHSALEDAWLAMQVFLYLKTPVPPQPFTSIPDPGLRNLAPVPPRPDGPLPRRKRRTKLTARPTSQ